MHNRQNLFKCILSILLFAFASANSCARFGSAAETVSEVCSATERTTRDASLSSDGMLVACIRYDATVAVYSVGSDEPLLITGPIVGGVSGVVFSTDGKLIAISSGQRIDLWSVRNGKQLVIDVPGDMTASITTVAFSSDGRKLAVSSGVLYHMNLHVFDSQTGELLGNPLEDVDGIASEIIFSGDGSRMAVNHWSTVYIIDAIQYSVLGEIAGRTASVFSQSGKLYAVSVDSLQAFEIVDSGLSGKSSGRFKPSELDTPRARVSIAGGAPVAVFLGGLDVVVRDLEGRELIRLAHQADPVESVKISSDGTTVLLVRESSKVELVRIR